MEKEIGMSTFEKCQMIRRMIINRAAEVMVYDNWDDEFAAKQIRNFPKELLLKEGNAFFGIQPIDLTETEMMELGFGRWDLKSKMRLIPLWLFPFLSNEIEVECLNGKSQTMKKSEMDTDHRFGCLAYGIIPKKR